MTFEIGDKGTTLDLTIGFGYSNEGGETVVTISVEFATFVVVNDKLSFELAGQGNATFPCTEVRRCRLNTSA